MLRKIGTIRIIDPSQLQKCSTSLQTPLDWIQKGSAGARGPTGPAGANGNRGTTGKTPPAAVATHRARRWSRVRRIVSPRLLRLSGKKEGLTLGGVRSGQGERRESVAIRSTPSDPRSQSATIGASDDTGAAVMLTHERPLATALLRPRGRQADAERDQRDARDPVERAPDPRPP
jgi:hypothetical protein